ncbi:hypothetical protein [Candidatus Galacturonibacter soehngenii]|uniref:PglD N-terminal domain-containing protein n=1 Tax=Candidatus Galacturonatibacter soehngenii TaxID=2307010 RepID=A0A7V7QLF1_9FIRM|nr:hypothetical protein [Candidatus Galacturonibacter soehngenii]KAB1438651.1 hypothetical protein F7O84_14085 [Candidatus Galacturonibacter soehngenii]
MNTFIIFMFCIISGGLGFFLSNQLKDKIIVSTEKQIDKFRLYYEVLNKWLKVEFDHYNIEDYFVERGYKTIAIYGMGELGNRLYERLDNSSIVVSYGIDRDPTLAFADLDILAFDEEERFEGVDCIVVSSVNAYDSIKKELRNKCDCDIISLEDVVYGM